MKPIVKDSRESFVYYIKGTNDIFGTYKELNQPLASIKDVENHREIWDCPLIVKEGKYLFEDGKYIRS